MTDLLALRHQQQLQGTISIHGDTMIANRALVFNAIAEGNARLQNLPNTTSISQTIACLQNLGVEIQTQPHEAWILGVGLRGIQAPRQPLPAFRSRDTLVLMLALLAGRPGIQAQLHGQNATTLYELSDLLDALRLLGATIQADQWPIRIEGNTLIGGSFAFENLSEELQTCMLLAALPSYGPLTIRAKPHPIDHVARMLTAMGLDLTSQKNSFTLFPPAHPVFPYPLSINIPADPDIAAWWWALACLHPNAQITTPAVLLHPARNQALKALQQLGANISIHNERQHASEHLADIQASTSQLKSTTIQHTHALAPWLICVLALVAAHAQGQTQIAVDTLDILQQQALIDGLQALGVDAQYQGANLIIRGTTQLQQAHIVGSSDLAPVWVLAAILAQGDPQISSYSLDQYKHMAHEFGISQALESH